MAAPLVIEGGQHRSTAHIHKPSKFEQHGSVPCERFSLLFYCRLVIFPRLLIVYLLLAGCSFVGRLVCLFFNAALLSAG